MKRKPDYMAVYTDRNGAEVAIEEDGDDWVKTKIKPVTVRAFGDTVDVFVLAAWLKPQAAPAKEE